MAYCDGCKIIDKQNQEIKKLREALLRISHAKPDGLDHSIDVAIIQRAARVAAEAL